LELSTWEKDDQVHSKLQVYALKVLFLSPPAKADDSQAIDDLSLPAAAQKSEPQPE